MSERIDTTYETEGYKCPYCGEMPTCDDWGFDYDGAIEECDDCGKKFKATANHSVEFEASPNCAINGELHKYKLDGRTRAYFCEECGACEIPARLNTHLWRD